MSDEGRTSIGARRRVAIVAAHSGELLRLRTPLLRAITSRGHAILCLCAQVSDADRLTLAGMDIAVATVGLEGGRLFALADRAATAALRRELEGWQPNVLLALGLRPMVIAALAARRLDQTRVVLMPASLADLADRNGAELGFSMRWSLRRALARAQSLVTNNADDATFFRQAGLVPPGLAVHVLPGAGVDLERFAPRPMPSADSGLVFTMIARAGQDTGAGAFAAAAANVKAKWPAARFVLAAAGVPAESASGAADGPVERVGLDDIDTLFATSHVFVHPAHQEGFAEDAAIALACGRPVITTDVPGCRETVDERVSGVVVPPRDSLALAQAMESFLRRPEDLSWMGQAARRKAERLFDVRDVNAALLDILELDGRA